MINRRLLTTVWAAFSGICVILFMTVLLLVWRRSPQESSQLVLPTPTPFQAKETGEFSTPYTPPAIVKDNKITISSEITVTMNPILRTPSEGKLYEVLGYSYSDSYISSITSLFNFTQKPEVTTDMRNIPIYFWENDTKTRSLQIIKDAGYLAYSNQEVFGKSDIGVAPRPLLTSINDSVTLASQTLRGYGLFTPEMSTDSSHINFFETSTGDDAPVSSFEQADLVKVSFYLLLDGKRIYYQNNNDEIASVWVNKTKNINKVEVRNIRIGNYKKVQLLSLSLIQDKLETGQGTIVALGDDTVYGRNPLEIKTISVDTAELAYIDDKKSTYIHPLFILKGKVTDTQKVTQSFIMYLPAEKL